MILGEHHWRVVGCIARCAGRRTWSTKTGVQLDRPVQSYISKSRDPYLNLSVEHHMLQKSHPDSAILFLYVNRPSIVLGRNQNPWIETNLSILKAADGSESNDELLETEPPGIGDVDLVRRRSGGGTVFHDEGNVNWTVISPAASFTRDKHAEMVVRGLRGLGVGRSRVNERHDIVLDQGRASFKGTWGSEDDTHSTPWQKSNPARRGALKVSGSAYKLTKGRALHHGTALLKSPNLNIISEYLRSPAKHFIAGRGVDSVSSPITNIMLENDEFIRATQEEFRKMYHHDSQAEVVDESWLDINDVRKGYDELKSFEWTFDATPQFTISSRPVDVDGKKTAELPGAPFMSLTVRNGAIIGTEVELPGLPLGQKNSLKNVLKDVKLHQIPSWHTPFEVAGVRTEHTHAFVHWLEDMLPLPNPARSHSHSHSHGHSHGHSHDHSHSH